jgi:Fe-S-cluster containining protein
VPWYVEGLRFACTACGKCCHNHGDGFAYVFSTRAERKALAQHFGLSLRAFEARYCTREAGRISFASRGDACIFLEDGRCSVYGLRPKQCRTFPFWPELLTDRETWERDVASFCPGAGQGELHDVNAIRAVMRQHGG